MKLYTNRGLARTRRSGVPVPLFLAALAICLFCLSGSATMPQDHPLPTYTVHHTTAKITIDGKVDEPAWKQAELFTDFRLADGTTKPTYKTEFRALWDDKNLYLAYVCYDPKIIATLTERDSHVYSEDCVEAFFSTGSELTRYYEFEFSPKNTVMDASVVQDVELRWKKDVDYSWNCAGLKTATHLEGAGKNQRWSIEIALPFTSIGRDLKPPTLGQQWRANFYRIEYSTPMTESICWSPIWGDSGFHTRDRFGHLVFAK